MPPEVTANRRSTTPTAPVRPLAAAVWGGVGAVAVAIGAIAEQAVLGPLAPGPVAVVFLLLTAAFMPGLPGAALGLLVARRRGTTHSALWGGAALGAVLLPPLGWMHLAGAVLLAVLARESRGRPTSLALALVAAGLLFAPTRWPVGARLDDGPSVLLITVAGLRADAPGTDALLDAYPGAVARFTQVASTSSDERAGVDAVLRGREACSSETGPGLGVLAAASGRPSAAFVRSPALREDDPVFDGFQRVDGEDAWLVGVSRVPLGWLWPTGGAHRRADATVERARWWLSRQQGPTFAWVHFDDLRGPLDPPPPFDERYRQSDGEPLDRVALAVPTPTTEGEVLRRYRGTAALVAHSIDQLVVAASAEGEEPPIVVVVGTTGTSLAEGQGWGAPTGRVSDWEVPLWIGQPDAERRELSAPVQTSEVYDWLGAALGPGDGGELARLLAGLPAERPTVASESQTPRGTVVSVANRSGRATAGARVDWEPLSDEAPLVQSLLEERARRLLSRCPTGTVE